MKTIYRKVEIKSEQDLPKEAGYYIAKHYRFGIGNYSFHPEIIKLHDYVSDFDWYLKPIEPQEAIRITRWMKFMSSGKTV